MKRRSRLPSPPRLRLSNRDNSILARTFRIDDPMSMPDRIDKLGPDDVVRRVAFQYHTEDAVDCSCCGRQKNHWSGFVAELISGKIALLGRNCGEDKHDLDYSMERRSFETLEKRQRALKRVLACQDQFRRLVITIDKLPTDPVVEHLQRSTQGLADSLPHLWNLLQPATDKGARPGELWASVRVRDTEAENARDARFDRKIQALARAEKLERTPENDRLLIEYHNLENDPDADRTPLYRSQRKAIGRFLGVPLITMVPQVSRNAAALIDGAEQALAPIADAFSDNITTTALNRAASDYMAVIRSSLDLIEKINGGIQFYDPSNLDGILQFANKVFKSRGKFTRNGTSIVWSALDKPGRSFDLLPPPVTLSRNAFDNLLKELAEASGSETKLPELT